MTNEQYKQMLGSTSATTRQLNAVVAGVSAPQSDLQVSKKRILTARSNPNAMKTTYSWCKKGWHTIGGKRHFYRSSWERNYAHYLQFLKEHGQIADWEFESNTFWFDKIKRGVRSYLPDFKITELSGSQTFHEVKGWMNSKSKTKLKRMAKYYPEVRMFVADSDWFKRNSKQMKQLIPGWI